LRGAGKRGIAALGRPPFVPTKTGGAARGPDRGGAAPERSRARLCLAGCCPVIGTNRPQCMCDGMLTTDCRLGANTDERKRATSNCEFTRSSPTAVNASCAARWGVRVRISSLASGHLPPRAPDLMPTMVNLPGRDGFVCSRSSEEHEAGADAPGWISFAGNPRREASRGRRARGPVRAGHVRMRQNDAQARSGGSVVPLSSRTETE
jgi:hypothetical protein